MSDASLHDFEAHRAYLTGLAYRMLGSVADAKDIVQDAFLRWHGTEREGIANVRAYLATIVTRLCLDELKAARRQRENYVGTWLPEPLIEDPALATDPADDVAADVSFALMLALERLSPLERAAFILHDVFEMDFEEIASALGRSPAACRQLAARARTHVKADRPRFAVTPSDGARLVEAFMAASRSGDAAAIRDLLAEGVVVNSDGGGRRTAALRPIIGADRVSRFFAGLAQRSAGAPPRWQQPMTVNGLPGYALVTYDGVLQTNAFEIVENRIAAIYIVRNPDKLAHVAAMVPPGLIA